MFNPDAYSESFADSYVKALFEGLAVRQDAERARQWPDQCLHRELAVTGVPGVFLCLEVACGEKIVVPELGATHRMSLASEPLELRAIDANSGMLMDALKGAL